MRVGMLGLGKLGLPVATAMALRGNDVMGYDIDPKRMSYEPQPYQETGPDGKEDFNIWLHAAEVETRAVGKRMLAQYRFDGTLQFGSMQQVADHAEIIFVAVQTPHDPRFEGVTVVKDDPEDFDYDYLRVAIQDLAQCVERPTVIAVISTVLPGTMRDHVEPLLNEHMQLVYNPSFIAMGTTMRDFLDPEFVLIGTRHVNAAGHDVAIGLNRINEFYLSTLPGVPVIDMSIESAELTKVCYNTAITQKIVLANTIMEICHKIEGANVDDVTRAMKAAHRRVTGPTYMDGGMGDGGGCHPRDNIALSWLATKLGLSWDPFGAAIAGREEQARWLALLIMKHREPEHHHIVIAGYAFKPGTNIIIGSPALLVASVLETEAKVEIARFWDPHVKPDHDEWDRIYDKPCVCLVGCRHEHFVDWDCEGLVDGSVVIDPFRIVKGRSGVEVIRLGE